MKCPKCGERMYLDNSHIIRFCAVCDTEVEVKPVKHRKRRDTLGHIFSVEEGK